MMPAIEKIIQLGVCAPSGDNSQPWRFVVRENTIEVWKLPSFEHSIYNFRQRGTLLTHGGLLENLSIAARGYGYAAGIQLFPKGKETDHVATVTLVSQPAVQDALFHNIQKRCTNRKPYADRPLAKDEQDMLERAYYGESEVRVQWVTEKGEMKRIAHAVSMTERIMLEDVALHDAFFSSVRWNEKEEKANSRGLYIKTLELAPPQQAVFSLLRYPSVARLGARIGMPAFIAKENAKVYAAASRMGAVIVPNEDDYFVTAGRVFERLWLSATSAGLSLQPVTAISYLAQRVEAGEAAALSSRYQEIIHEADTVIRSAFSIPSTHVVAMIFRIGHGGSPTARASRLAPDIS